MPQSSGITLVRDLMGNPPLRSSYRKPRGRKGGRILIECGCCSQRLEIYTEHQVFPESKDPNLESIEINGVEATAEQWRQIFGPVLGMTAKQNA